MIFAINLSADTWTATVFDEVKKFYEEKEIPMQNILQYAAHGAAAMVGGAWRIYGMNENENTWTYCNSLRFPPAAFLHRQSQC